MWIHVPSPLLASQPEAGASTSASIWRSRNPCPIWRLGGMFYIDQACTLEAGHEGDHEFPDAVRDELFTLVKPVDDDLCAECGAYWKCDHRWRPPEAHDQIVEDGIKLGDTFQGKALAAQLQGDLVPTIGGLAAAPDSRWPSFAQRLSGVWIDDQPDNLGSSYPLVPFRAWYTQDGFTWRAITQLSHRGADSSRPLERMAAAVEQMRKAFAEIAATVNEKLAGLFGDHAFALGCAVYLLARSRKWRRACNARAMPTVSFAITPRIRGPPQLGAHFLTSASSVTTGGGRSCHRRPSKEGMMPDISFAWTTPALLARAKTCTRRDWANERYARQFREGITCTATDRQRRYGGKPIALIKLTADAVLESTRDAPESDYAAEGFDFLTKIGATVDKLSPMKLWRIWKVSPRDMYVVRFEVVRFLVPHLHWCPECDSQNPHADPACADGTERGCGAGNHTRRLL